MKKQQQVEDTGLFDKIVAETPKETKNFIDLSLEIAHQIELMMANKGMLQKDLATAMNKTEAEISKWLSGFHNFTIKTIAKIEAVLNDKVITTPYRIQTDKLEMKKSIHVNIPSQSTAPNLPNEWEKTSMGQISLSMAA